MRNEKHTYFYKNFFFQFFQNGEDASKFQNQFICFIYLFLGVRVTLSGNGTEITFFSIKFFSLLPSQMEKRKESAKINKKNMQKGVYQRLGATFKCWLTTGEKCMFFLLFLCLPFFLLSFFPFVMEKDGKTCFKAETNDLDQQTTCRAPVHW